MGLIPETIIVNIQHIVSIYLLIAMANLTSPTLWLIPTLYMKILFRACSAIDFACMRLLALNIVSKKFEVLLEAIYISPHM
jgi:hypothetical protein